MSLFESIDKEKLTPMMRQYASIKDQALDSILMYRIGDFYEMFFDDAIEASRVLGLALTGRDCGLDKRAPMCGVPHHASLTYVKKLIENNYKVAICEQLEEPGQGKALVERGIIKIYTPGTIIDTEYLSDDDNNFLASIYVDDNISIAYADISTGELYVSNDFVFDSFKSIYDEIMRIHPKEIIVNDVKLYSKFKELGYYTVLKNEVPNFEEIKEKISEFTGIDTSVQKNVDNLRMSILNLFKYLSENKNVNLKHIDNIISYDISKYLELDESAIRNLELSKNITDNTKKGSLLSILDKTITSKGARRLKAIIERPLKDIREISYRQNVVEVFYNNPIEAETIKNLLSNTFDIERIASKISEKSASPQDLLNLKETLRIIPLIKDEISALGSESMKRLSDLDEHKEIYTKLQDAISDEPSMSINDGYVIRHGYNSELDEIRDDRTEITDKLINYENELRAKTDIKTLRIKYNKLAGYYIEVSKGQTDKVSDEFERTQTLKNAERYKTKKLREIEYNVLNSSSIALALEKTIYFEMLDSFMEFIPSLKKLAFDLAEIDVYIALSTVARENRYVRPKFNTESKIELVNARHPVIEMMNNLEEFIPNDVNLNMLDRVAIITGPNMSGKSTYMRMVAIIQIMAQIGSFIPADSGDLSVVDKIFTRIGASDSLYSGKSTFMVEMSEVSYILKNATKNSLIILDEVGRGTSTFDGMAIAKAVVLYITDRVKAFTLFSTHYQELSNLEALSNIIFNLTLKIKEEGNDIMFLRKVTPGITSKSYGIHVAKLAGLPDEVISKARKFQKDAEINYRNGKQVDFLNNSYEEEPAAVDNSLRDYILSLDINSMTPIDAMMEINNIIKKAKE